MKELETALKNLQLAQDKLVVEEEPSDKSRQLLQLTASVLGISQLIFSLIQAIDQMKDPKKDPPSKPKKPKIIKSKA